MKVQANSYREKERSQTEQTFLQQINARQRDSKLRLSVLVLQLQRIQLRLQPLVLLLQLCTLFSVNRTKNESVQFRQRRKAPTHLGCRRTDRLCSLLHFCSGLDVLFLLLLRLLLLAVCNLFLPLLFFLCDQPQNRWKKSQKNERWRKGEDEPFSPTCCCFSIQKQKKTTKRGKGSSGEREKTYSATELRTGGRSSSSRENICLFRLLRFMLYCLQRLLLRLGQTQIQRESMGLGEMRRKREPGEHACSFS